MPTRTVVSTARTVNSTRPSSSTASVQFSTPSGIPRPVNTTARESSPAYHTPSNKSDSEALPIHAEGPRSNSDPDAQSTGTVGRRKAHTAFLRFNLMPLARLKADTSDIPDQDIIIDGTTNRIHHILRPDLSEPATPVEDAEIAKLRALYPEPFSENDPNPSRRPPKYAPIGFTGAIPELSGMGVASGSGNTANFRRFTNDSGRSDRNRSQSGFRDIPPHLMRNNGGAGGNPNDPDPSDHGGPPSDSDDDAGSERTNDYGSEDEGNPGDLNLRARYTSAEPTLTEKREWVYDPTPQSEEEMLKAAFRPLEELIDTYLLCDPVKGNGSIQKTLLQSIPKPGNYNGQNNLTTFDDWVRDLVKWLNIAGLCGKDVRYSESKQSFVLTSVDIQRTNALSMFVKESARQWMIDVVERVPHKSERNSDLPNGRYTFKQWWISMKR
ncbi:hypothetical protein L218DRAFT_989575 [Marasmius fiardii PR-910]|nr:hypothetical protein L218DRAFT_989575 [Marasmius fiardii PR-910]